MAIFLVYLSRAVTQSTVVRVEGNSPRLGAILAANLAPAANLWKTTTGAQARAYRIDEISPDGDKTVWMSEE